MNHELARALARARQHDLLHEAAERRRLRITPAHGHPLRLRIGCAIASLGRSVARLGEAIALS